MADIPRNIPNFLKKKTLLNSTQLEKTAAREYGQKFLAIGWLDDALEFFLKAADADGLEEIRKICLEQGDAFLLDRILKAQAPEEPETWQQVGEQALALGKFHFAVQSFAKAKNEVMEARARKLLEDSVAPPPVHHVEE